MVIYKSLWWEFFRQKTQAACNVLIICKTKCVNKHAKILPVSELCLLQTFLLFITESWKIIIFNRRESWAQGEA